MSWINRCIVPIFSLALLAAPALPARADAPIVAQYGRQSLRFTHVSTSTGTLAIGIDDPALRALLRSVGATLAWNPGDRYVLVTTAAPAVVSFAVGDRRYDVGPIALQAAIAPYRQGSEVYLPFNELLRGLELAPRPNGSVVVLQPQLASLDVRTSGSRTDLVAQAGAPLHPRVVSQTPSTIAYEFDGVGTTLAGTRTINAGGIRTLTLAQNADVLDPKTTLTVTLAPNAVHDVPHSNDDRNVVISFAASAAQAAAQPAAPVAAAPQAPPQTSGAASVTGVSVTPSSDGYQVAIAISGDASFEWHRLRDPDNRFWVDVKSAQLQGAPMDQAEPAPVGGLRVRQIDSTTVRVALSLSGPKTLAISPSADGLTVDVSQADVDDATAMARAGQGSVGSVVAANEQAAPVTPAPYSGSSSSSDSAWKFGNAKSSYVARNPRLIVIDPGHGGSDRGSSRHGTDEAALSLDMAKRLRDILVAQGWQVKLTHDTDVDVFAPNDSAHDELQARVDVGNNAGARMFVSIHVNAFINSGPYGTTVYISKPGDVALARPIEAQLAGDGTKDDGIVKSHLYVTLHSVMPAVLVETAFISNPSDYALLTSPAWRQKVAQMIAAGIAAYDRQNPASNQPAQ